MHQNIQSMEQLSPSDIESLTQLLCLNHTPPTTAWLQDQVSLLRTFPPPLLRSLSPLARLALHLPFTPPKAVLCVAHKALNPLLIRRIFLQISAECTTRIQRLRTHPNLEFEVGEFVERMQALNALWMSSQVYAAMINPSQKPQTRPRFRQIDSGCEACILAAVGGDRQAMVDLRSSCLARKKKRSPVPRLLPLIEGWIDWSGDGDLIRLTSEELGRQVRAVRRQLQTERREKRKEIKCTGGMKSPPISSQAPVPVPLPTEDDTEEHEKGIGDRTLSNQEEADFEGSIISFYRHMISTASLLGHTGQPGTTLPGEDDIHEAFRDSFKLHSNAGTSHRNTSTPKRNSVHSQDIDRKDLGLSESGSSLKSEAGMRPTRHSKTYRDLVGIPEGLDDEYELQNSGTGDNEKEPSRSDSSGRRSSWSSSVYSRTTNGEHVPAAANAPPVPQMAKLTPKGKKALER